MNQLGHLSIWLGLAAVTVSSLSYVILNLKDNHTGARQAAKMSYIGFTACVTVAGVWLLSLIIHHDFAYDYVARYSSRDLPLLYLVSSFWAGQEGSFLLWVIIGAWLGIFLMQTSGKHEPRVMLIYNLNVLFLMVLLIKQSPFRVSEAVPGDGSGMNMLLQDPWMAIHPPVVFLGYAAYAVPFAYAVSALWRRDYDDWIRPGLPWAIFSYVTLGAGIIIGGFWSYKVLGWGGYWGWDPVENASLLPWLAGTALVHGMILQQRQKRLRKTNFFLAAFAFVLVIYCTFLTRSGILADFSVHSFTDLGITGWLVLFMAIFVSISLWLLVFRAREIPVSDKGEITYFSREFGLIAAMVLLCLSCLLTGLGTSAPLITRMMEKASKVSTEFYVQTNFPLALALLLLLSFVPLLSFGRNHPSRLLKKLHWAFAGAAIALAVIIWRGVPSPGVLLLAVFAGGATGLNLVLALQLAGKRFSTSSGALVHLGVGLMFIGIVASSVYDRSEKDHFAQGTPTSALGYDITLSDPRTLKHGKGTRMELPLNIARGKKRFSAMSDIYQEDQTGKPTQRFIHPYIKRGLVSDLYISPVDFVYGEEPETSNHILVEKGKTVRQPPYTLTFKGFNIPKSMGAGKKQAMQVGADVNVAYKDEAPVLLKPVFSVGRPMGPESRVQLPGPADAFITLVRIDAGAKTIALIYEGPDSGSVKAAESPELQSSVILNVSVKPGMTVLWIGTFLMLFGGVVGIIRHRQNY